MAGRFKFLALMNAVAMALPLGWCCPRPLAAADDAEAGKTARCPNCQPQGRPAPHEAPSAPDVPEKCPCCQVRASMAPEPSSAASVANLWVPLSAAIVPDFARCDVRPDEQLQFPGPPLRILHCIWRC